jgi:hypothetical protein
MLQSIMRKSGSRFSGAIRLTQLAQADSKSAYNLSELMMLRDFGLHRAKVVVNLHILARPPAIVYRLAQELPPDSCRPMGRGRVIGSIDPQA